MVYRVSSKQTLLLQIIDQQLAILGSLVMPLRPCQKLKMRALMTAW